MTAADPQGQDLKGQDPKCQHPNGLGPVGQVRIYQGAQHRFIWRYLSAKLSACDAVRGNIFNINCFPLMAQQQAHE